MKMNRRQFIINTGNAALAMSALPLMVQCAGMSRREWGNCEDHGEVPTIGAHERIIFCLASLAPSGHNAQPWTLRKRAENTWIIGSARDRWLPAVDPENRELLLSIGAFLENIVISSEHFGYRPRIRVIATSPLDGEIAEVAFSPVQPVSREQEIARIRRRRTLRREYLDRELSSEDSQRMISHSSQRIFYFPRLSQGGNFLAEGTIDANRLQAWRNPAQEELSRWIRWSDAEARRHLNGITPESMEITGFAGWFVRHFFNASSVMAESFRNKTVEIVREQVRGCAGWIVITSPDSHPATLIDTGRLFQRVFLSVREMQIGFHPMTQILEEVQWRNRVAPALGVAGQVQFVIRVGYVRSYPEPVSLRMPLSRIIV